MIVMGTGPNRPIIWPIPVDRIATTTPAGRKASAVDIADHPARLCRYWVSRNWNAM